MAGAPTQPVPRCPRCGYDQSGLIATWNESCPLAALCTECGYSFDPADAIHPTRKRLPWLYEHAKHWWNVRAWWRTVLMLLWPPLFWKRVRPEHEVKIGQLIAMFVPMLVIALGGPLLLLLTENATSGRILHYTGRVQSSWSDSITDGIRDFLTGLSGPLIPAEVWRLSNLTAALLFLGIFWLPSTLAFLAISSEWAGTRLTRKHLARLTSYAALPFLIPSVVASVWQQGLGWYRIVYLLQPQTTQVRWPTPWRIQAPDLGMPAIIALTLVWLPLYWFCAIRYGYALPSTKRPFLVVLAVLLTPWALFLAFAGYYAFIA